MSAGLPGVGLGAVLYTILILMMPLSAILAVRRSSWANVGRQLGLLLAMISIAWLESEVAVWLGLLSPSRWVRLLPLLLLLLVFGTLELLRLISKRVGRDAA